MSSQSSILPSVFKEFEEKWPSSLEHSSWYLVAVSLEVVFIMSRHQLEAAIFIPRHCNLWYSNRKNLGISSCQLLGSDEPWSTLRAFDKSTRLQHP